MFGDRSTKFHTSRLERLDSDMKLTEPNSSWPSPWIAGLRSLGSSWIDVIAADRLLFLALIAMFVIRFVAAALTPLMCDEAYYWVWSKYLQFGYYDHPPMVAYLIRLGTAIAGDTEVGVRLLSLLTAIPMTWAVYLSGKILIGSRRAGLSCALLLNAMMMVWVGTYMASPDAPLMLSCSVVLLGLAQVYRTGRGWWWLLVGAGAGCALLSKLNGLLIGPTILLWLAFNRPMRSWLLSPWPYLGGLVAVGVVSPMLWWNAQHDWVTFVRQLSRTRVSGFNPKFVLEFITGQILIATPLVFLLAGQGLYGLAVKQPLKAPAASLIGLSIWPTVLYFGFHSLHGGVHPNWLAHVYPAVAIASAVAVHRIDWKPNSERIIAFCYKWSAPGSMLLFLLMIVQIETGVLTWGRRDPLVGVFAVGFEEVAAEIEALQIENGASCILTSGYGAQAWLAFYRPQLCVAQQNERVRWPEASEPSPARLKGKLLFVSTDHPASMFGLEAYFHSVRPLKQVVRYRGRSPIETYDVVLLENPRGDVFNRALPRDVR